MNLIQRADSASNDVRGGAEKIRSFLKDLREALQAESREDLAKLDHNELSVMTAPTAAGRHLTDLPVTQLVLHGDQRI